MIPGEPSRTAKIVAATRAAHLRYDPPPHFVEDPIGARLLGDEAEALIAMHGEGAPWILLENRLFLPFRARYVEDLVARIHREGVRQLVILGAGLDTFAWRRPEALGDLRIFEVDHPATQGWKRARIAEIGLALPPWLRFVECDFEKSAVDAALAATDFRADAPAIVSWMGVVYYLTRSAVDETLGALARLLAPGSAVVLDYQYPMESLPQRYRDVYGAQTEFLRGAGEPQQNRYRPDELETACREAGFARVELPSNDAIRARYFEPLGSRIAMSERFGMAVAWR